MFLVRFEPCRVLRMGDSKFRAAEAIGQLQLELPPRDKVVGGTGLAVVVREGSEAEAECDTVL